MCIRDRSDTAVKYFKKLNEEYNKGIVDPESFTQTYDEYLSLIHISDKRLVGIGKRNESFYSLKENPGVLRLYTNKEQILSLIHI